MTPAALLLATACPLFATGPAQEHPLKIPNGPALTARDPYGGTLARNRLFFDFSLRGDVSQVQKAEWALDGKVVRTDDKAPFEWKGVSGSDKRMPAGAHTITVTAYTAAGQASTQFGVTATNCQPAGADMFLPRHPGTVRLRALAAAEPATSQPPFDGVSFTATKNVTVRGRAHGTLQVDGTRYRFSNGLKRGKLRLAFHPGRKRFLTVTGLPKGAKAVTVRLDGGAVRIRDIARAWFIKATLTGRGDTATVTNGGRYV